MNSSGPRDGYDGKKVLPVSVHNIYNEMFHVSYSRRVKRKETCLSQSAN